MGITQFGGWPFGVDLDYMLNEVKVHTRFSSSGSWDHLGDTDAYRDQILASAINRAMDEYRRRLPVLNKTTTTQALTANTSKYDIPSDLHGTGIAEMYWSDSGTNSLKDLKPLRYLTQAEIDQLDPSWKNGELTQEFPEGWGFTSTDKTQYQLFPTPDSATPVLTIEYRKEPRYVTADMLSNLTHTITNANFATDSDWTKGAGWAIAGGVATFTGAESALTQAITTLVRGQTWRFEFDVPAVEAGTVTVEPTIVGFVTGGISTFNSAGHHVADIEIDYFSNASPTLGFTGLGTTTPDIDVDNVTIRQILPGVLEMHQRLFALRVAMDVLEPENYERRPILEVFYEKEMKEAQKLIGRDHAILRSGNTGLSRGNSHVATGKLFSRLDDSTAPRRRR